MDNTRLQCRMLLRDMIGDTRYLSTELKMKGTLDDKIQLLLTGLAETASAIHNLLFRRKKGEKDEPEFMEWIGTDYEHEDYLSKYFEEEARKKASVFTSLKIIFEHIGEIEEKCTSNVGTSNWSAFEEILNNMWEFLSESEAGVNIKPELSYRLYNARQAFQYAKWTVGSSCDSKTNKQIKVSVEEIEKQLEVLQKVFSPKGEGV